MCLPSAQVDAWTENICEGALKKLSGLKKHYKYVVTCTIMQKCGAGIHCSRASVMDAEKDLVVKVRGRWDALLQSIRHGC